jgi:hypothetical protein
MTAIPIRRISRFMKKPPRMSSPDYKNRNFYLFVDYAVGNAAEERRG